jgi:hypothetical protein
MMSYLDGLGLVSRHLISFDSRRQNEPISSDHRPNARQDYPIKAVHTCHGKTTQLELGKLREDHQSHYQIQANAVILSTT